MGDESSISIYKSRWIQLPWDFKIISLRTLLDSSRVSDLLDEFGRWNVELVRNYYLTFDMNVILQLLRPSDMNGVTDS